jgi:hypothetical protein
VLPLDAICAGIEDGVRGMDAAMLAELHSWCPSEVFGSSKPSGAAGQGLATSFGEAFSQADSPFSKADSPGRVQDVQSEQELQAGRRSPDGGADALEAGMAAELASGRSLRHGPKTWAAQPVSSLEAPLEASSRE